MSIYELLKSKNNFAYVVFGDKILFYGKNKKWVVSNRIRIDERNNKSFKSESEAVEFLLKN